MLVPLAQMIKYGSNAFLANKVSFINEIAQICESVGADIKDVINGMGLDPRIGSNYMQPGTGFGGPCLEKDLEALVELGNFFELESTFMKAILKRNERQIDLIRDKVIKELKFGSQAQYDSYKRKHHIKKGTQITVGGKKTTHKGKGKISKASAKKADKMAADMNAKLDALEKEMKKKKKNEGKLTEAQYKTISLKTTKGYKEAEKLQKQGWVVAHVGLFTIDMVKEGVKEGKLTEGRKVKYKKNDWKKYNQLVKKGKTVMIQTSFGDEFAWEDGSNYGVFGSESDGREIELSHDDIDQVEIF